MEWQREGCQMQYEKKEVFCKPKIIFFKVCYSFEK